MKYQVTAFYQEKEYHVDVNVRRDASKKTVFLKCMNAIAWKMVEKNVISANIRFSYDLPNIWRNGYLGAAWFIDPYINVTIWEDHGDYGTYIAA